MEPIATDAIFVAPRIQTLHGRFSTRCRPHGQRKPYWLLDPRSHRLALNPFHNDTKIRYEGTSNLPHGPPAAVAPGLRGFSRCDHGELSSGAAAGSAHPATRRTNHARARPTNTTRPPTIERYLKSHYPYTLDLSGPRTADPLANFLFTRRAGHCEYFAAAMTVMLRDWAFPRATSPDFFPANTTTSAATTSFAPATRTPGWKSISPATAGSLSIPRRPETMHAAACSQRLGCTGIGSNIAWGEWIVNYDFGHQLTLAQNVQKTSRDWGDERAQILPAETAAGAGADRQLDRQTEASPYFLPGVLAVSGGAADLSARPDDVRLPRWRAGGCARAAAAMSRLRSPRWSTAKCCAC